MNTTNDITELIYRLRYFNAWRRGAEGEQPNPCITDLAHWLDRERERGLSDWKNRNNP